MAVAFDQGLFAQSTPDRGQTGGGLSGGASFIANAVNNATTLGSENVFDSITKPLRQRKRRAAHTEATESGIKPGSPEYFDFMEKRLGEFGDLEGVETVAATRKAEEDRQLQIKKTVAETNNLNSQINARDVGTVLEQDKFQLEKLTTAADLRRAAAELTELSKTSLREDQKLLLDQRIVEIKERLAVVDASLKGAQTESLRAGTETEIATRQGKVDKITADVNNVNADTDLKTLRTEIEEIHGVEEARLKLEETQANINRLRADTASTTDKTKRDNELQKGEVAFQSAKTELVHAQGRAESQKARAAALWGNPDGKPPAIRDVNKARVKQVQPEVTKLLTDNNIRLGSKEKLIFAAQYAHAIEALRQAVPDFDELPRPIQSSMAWNRAKKFLTKVPGKAYGENDAVVVEGVPPPAGVTDPGAGGVKGLSDDQLFQ